MFRGACLLIILCGSLSADETEWLTGSRFRRAMNEPLTANWRSVPLQSVLERISIDRHVAIVLDRRIDPTQQFPVEFVNDPLQQGLSKLARQFDGDSSVPGNLVYLGPADSTRKLRTLIALRSGELANHHQIPKARQQRLLQPLTVSWDDLDSPRDILGRLLQDVELKCSDLSVVEHDLWRAGELPQVTPVAAISLILVQFDLTFQWQDDGQELELMPIPETVKIERPHQPRGQSAEKAAQEWQAQWPEATFRPAGRDVLVVATEEEHEEITAGRVGRRKPAPTEAPVPLVRQEFTLRIKDTPVRELMAELEKSGVVFEYDSNELVTSGIDLKTLIELDVRKLSAEEFFQAVFDPLGLESTIDGMTVTLRPK